MVTVPWPRNERGALAGLKTTSYAENVVALAYAHEARGERGDLRQHRRRPVRGHRVQRLLRAWTGSCARRRWPSGCLAGVTRALVLEWCDVARGRRAAWRCWTRADEIFLRLHHPRRPGRVHRCDDRRLEAAGTGHPDAAGALARPTWRRGRRPVTGRGSGRTTGSGVQGPRREDRVVASSTRSCARCPSGTAASMRSTKRSGPRARPARAPRRRGSRAR